jgi:hypothetical protein
MADQHAHLDQSRELHCGRSVGDLASEMPVAPRLLAYEDCSAEFGPAMRVLPLLQDWPIGVQWPLILQFHGLQFHCQ